MKKGILFSLTLLLSLSMFAQKEEVIRKESQMIESVNNEEFKSMETFSKKKSTHGVYLGFGGGYAAIGKHDFATIETRFAYVNDQQFEIGFGSQVFQSFESIATNGEENQYVGGALGGLHLKAIFFGRKKMHLSIPLFLGVGAVAVFEEDHRDFFDCFDPDVVASSPFLVAEPGVNVEFNLSKVFGFEVGARYRISSQTDFLENEINDLNGVLVSAMLKVGLFDFGGRRNRTRQQQ